MDGGSFPRGILHRTSRGWSDFLPFGLHVMFNFVVFPTTIVALQWADQVPFARGTLRRMFLAAFTPCTDSILATQDIGEAISGRALSRCRRHDTYVARIHTGWLKPTNWRRSWVW